MWLEKIFVAQVIWIVGASSSGGPFIKCVEHQCDEYLPLDCKNRKLDIGFLLDISSNLKDDIHYETQFLLSLANAFVRHTNTRLGIITFAKRAVYQVELNKYENSSLLDRSLHNLVTTNEMPRRDKAFQYAFHKLFIDSRDATKLIVLLTNDSQVPHTEFNPLDTDTQTHGTVRNDLRSISKAFSKNEIDVVVVGTGSRYNSSEFFQLTGGKSENLFYGRSFRDHLRSDVMKTIVGKYCRPIRLPDMERWRKTSLVRQPSPIVYNTTLAIIPQLHKEYKLVLQFKPSRELSGWRTVLHFTQHGNDVRQYGDHIPAIYYNRREEKLEIGSAVNDNPYFSKQITEISPDTWHTIEISQVKEWDGYYFMVVVNGDKVVRVINKEPKAEEPKPVQNRSVVKVTKEGFGVTFRSPQGPTDFYNVTVYCGNPWYPSQTGLAKNIFLYFKEKDKDTYVRTAGLLISIGFLAFIGAGYL